MNYHYDLHSFNSLLLILQCNTNYYYLSQFINLTGPFKKIYNLISQKFQNVVEMKIFFNTLYILTKSQYYSVHKYVKDKNFEFHLLQSSYIVLGSNISTIIFYNN